MPIDRYCTLKECREGGGCQSNPRPPAGTACVYEYVAAEYEEPHQWKGDDAPPKRWWSSGTLVYRSMSDFYDD